jgi:hypothetical protein
MRQSLGCPGILAYFCFDNFSSAVSAIVPKDNYGLVPSVLACDSSPLASISIKFSP